MQPSIVLGVKVCLADRKVVHCTEKVRKGSEMLWYGYIYNWTFGIVKGVKVEFVQPFLRDHKMTDDASPTSSVVIQKRNTHKL